MSAEHMTDPAAPVQIPVRDAHKELTRTRILDAALAELGAGAGDGLTILSVALRAGVTERTVYRHFPTRDDLLAAVWPRMQARVGSTGFPSSADDLVAMPAALFARFDREAALVEASVYAKGGREVRMKANDARKAAFIASVKQAFPDLDGPELYRRAAVAQLLNSAYAWSVLRDFWGLDGAEAGRAVSDTLARLLNRPAPAAGLEGERE